MGFYYDQNLKDKLAQVNRGTCQIPNAILNHAIN